MDDLIIALTGAPGWADTLTVPGFTLRSAGKRSGYLRRLVDWQTALVVVDGDRAGWEFYVTSPKVNAATRRIPVIFTAARADGFEEARLAGADACLLHSEVGDRLPGLAASMARGRDSEARERLAEQCDDPLPPEALAGIEKFNAGAFYKQHDLFEALWMEESGPVRDLYQAILQVGIAYHQITRNNRRGAYKMILRAFQWLNVLPNACQGVDVARLREDATRLRAALEALPDGADADQIDRALLGKVHLVGEDA